VARTSRLASVIRLCGTVSSSSVANAVQRLHPGSGEGYNSNSFAQGLLNSTGYVGGLNVGNTVGSGKPVPPHYFKSQ